MKVLLDTHVLLWWMSGDPRLDQTGRTAIANTDDTIMVSSASAWEIATKYRKGKLPEAKAILKNYDTILKTLGFSELVITSRHAKHAGLLAIRHNDPFDRILMAQAELEGFPIIT